MYYKYYPIFCLIILILLFCIFYNYPVESFNRNINTELIQMGCFYLKQNRKYLAFTSNQNISHVYLSERQPSANPPNGKNPLYYQQNGELNAFSYQVDINLEEPQKWKFEQAPNGSLFIKTYTKPVFYLGCDCDGKVYTTLIKGSSNQWWTLDKFNDNFTIRSTRFKHFLTYFDRDGYLLPNSRGNVFASSETSPTLWEIIPCIQGRYVGVSSGPCSSKCGTGTQTINIECQKNGIKVDKMDCIDSPTIPDSKSCYNLAGCEPYWKVGTWGGCSSVCGNGEKKRSVECVYKLNNGRIINASPSGPFCKENKPVTTKHCRSTSGCNRGWETGSFGNCSVKCGTGIRNREVTCLLDLPHNEHLKINGARCDLLTKPTSKELCTNDSSCNTFWKTGEWSNCSTTCGTGSRERTAVCKMVINGVAQTVSDSKCKLAKPPTSKECTDDEGCEWVTGNWTTCSSVCGPGTQSRTVSCRNTDNNIVDNNMCSKKVKPVSSKQCEETAGCKWETGNWKGCNTTISTTPRPSTTTFAPRITSTTPKPTPTTTTTPKPV